MEHDCDTAPNPDECFRCKMRYFRAKGGFALHWQGGKREFFHESTIPERQRKIVADAAKNGWEARPVNPLYDRPANSSQRKTSANG